MEGPPLPTGEEGSQPSTAALGPEKDPANFSVRIVSIDYYMARPIPGVDVCYSSFQGDAFTNAVSLAMEKALKLKGNAGVKRQHMHGCSLVRARRFYGYHASEELFVKIYLYHPHDVSRAAKLLLIRMNPLPSPPCFHPTLGGCGQDGALRIQRERLPSFLLAAF